MGTFTMSRAAFDALAAAQGAVIINISATLHYGATWYQVGCCPVLKSVSHVCSCPQVCTCPSALTVPGPAAALSTLALTLLPRAAPLRAPRCTRRRQRPQSTPSPARSRWSGASSACASSASRRGRSAAPRVRSALCVSLARARPRAYSLRPRRPALSVRRAPRSHEAPSPHPTPPPKGLSKLAPGGDGRTVEEVVVSSVPLGRLGEKRDIALACVFLASPAARRVFSLFVCARTCACLCCARVCRAGLRVPRFARREARVCMSARALACVAHAPRACARTQRGRRAASCTPPLPGCSSPPSLHSSPRAAQLRVGGDARRRRRLVAAPPAARAAGRSVSALAQGGVQEPRCRRGGRQRRRRRAEQALGAD